MNYFCTLLILTLFGNSLPYLILRYDKVIRLQQYHSRHCRILASSCPVTKLFLSTGTKSIDGIGLNALINHLEDGQYLQSAIQIWLDNEYLPQEIHRKLGLEVQKLYIRERMSGVNDLGELLIDIGTNLESFNMEDAFVNAWDVANKVSDLLMNRMRMETSPCAGDMTELINKYESQLGNSLLPLSIDLNKMTKALNSKFARYCFMREFLEGESSWNQLSAIVAIMLGYRSSETSEIVRKKELCAFGWEDLSLFPTNSFLTSSVHDGPDSNFEMRITDDIPEDEGSTDLLCESLVGLESYVAMKQEAGLNADNAKGEGDDVNIIVRRRILLTKWLYVHGFLDEDFPPTVKYIPFNLR